MLADKTPNFEGTQHDTGEERISMTGYLYQNDVSGPQPQHGRSDADICENKGYRLGFLSISTKWERGMLVL